MTKAVRDNGVNIDAVDDIMSDMEEVFLEQQDIDMAIVDSNERLYPNVDEQELLEELEKLRLENEEPIITPVPKPITIVDKPLPVSPHEKDLEDELDRLVDNLSQIQISKPEQERISPNVPKVLETVL